MRAHLLLKQKATNKNKTAAFVVTFEKYITIENKTIKTEYFCTPTWINTIPGY